MLAGAGPGRCRAPVRRRSRRAHVCFGSCHSGRHPGRPGVCGRLISATAAAATACSRARVRRRPGPGLQCAPSPRHPARHARGARSPPSPQVACLVCRGSSPWVAASDGAVPRRARACRAPGTGVPGGRAARSVGCPRGRHWLALRGGGGGAPRWWWGAERGAAHLPRGAAAGPPHVHAGHAGCTACLPTPHLTPPSACGPACLWCTGRGERPARLGLQWLWRVLFPHRARRCVRQAAALPCRILAGARAASPRSFGNGPGHGVSVMFLHVCVWSAGVRFFEAVARVTRPMAVDGRVRRWCGVCAEVNPNRWWWCQVRG